MTYRRNVVEEISEDISAYLTEEERMRLLSDLHMALTWVGIKIPENIKVRKISLLAKGEEISFERSGNKIILDVPQVLDHEIIGIDF